MNDLPAAILLALAGPEPQPVARLRKQLGWPMSVLLRELHPLAALGLIEWQREARRECVGLTVAGRALLVQTGVAALSPEDDRS